MTSPTKDSTNFEEDLVWYGVVDMNTKYISSSGRKISNKCFKKNKFVKSGALLMSSKLSVGRLAFTTVDCFTNEAIVNFKFNEGISGNYMYYILENVDIESYGTRGSQGVTLNSTSLNSIIVPIPNYSKQIEVDNYLSSLDDLIQYYKKK